MIAREKFLAVVRMLVGRPVVWGDLDCSDLVARGVLGAGGPDQRSTHRAQTYFNETRPLQPLERAIPGDLVFYGRWSTDVTTTGPSVIHVAIVDEHGEIISADGATSKITDPKVAALNPSAKVKVHGGVHFRNDYLGVHRNTILDAIDFTTR